MNLTARLLLLTGCLLEPAGCLAQASSPARASPQAGCPEIQYEAPLAEATTPASPLVVDRLEGQVVVSIPQVPRMLGTVRGFCVALFKQGPVKAVATRVSNDQGMFVFDNVPEGDYVLIGRHESGEGSTLRTPVRLSGRSQDSNQSPNENDTPATRGLLLRVERHGGPQSGTAQILSNLDLRRTLLARLKTDQDIRMKMIGEGMTTVSPETQARLEEVDRQTEAMLSSILAEHGWPGLDMVGVDGTQAASTMLQHASAETAKRALPLVEAAFRAGNVLGPNYASLVDKVRIAEGRPQLYGTSAKPFERDREIVFHPIEDEANVEARRAEMGLPSLEEYRKLLREMYFPRRARDAGPSPRRAMK